MVLAHESESGDPMSSRAPSAVARIVPAMTARSQDEAGLARAVWLLIEASFPRLGLGGNEDS